MATELLYLNDSYLTECDARVTACTPVEGGFDVQLERTPFFPTGGGQPHDTGMLNDIPVTDVVEAGDTVLHRTPQPLPVGALVRARVDWARRFDHMQQHSGEHILSFAAKELFGANNVGFHMAREYCTVDFDMPLSREQVAALELRTNEYVARSLPVEISYVTPEQLAGMALRKAAKGLTGSIRIVSMPGGDSCTCCATHVRALGEVGQVKIAACEAYKGGARLTFHCGLRALRHGQAMQDIADGIARRFSVKVEDAPAAVARLQEEENALRRESKALWARLSGYLAQELLRDAPVVKGVTLCARLFDDLPPAQLKPLGQALCKRANAMALLCAASGESIQYLLCCSEGVGLDMGEAIQAVNAALGGRGGGRGTLAQGSARASTAAAGAVEQLRGYFLQRLKAAPRTNEK